MDNRIDQITKGLISLAVMLMFAVAFIAGEARANMPADALVLGDRAQGSEAGVVLHAGYLPKLETFPHLIELFLALPIDVDSHINDRSMRNDDPHELGSEDSFVK